VLLLRLRLQLVLLLLVPAVLGLQGACSCGLGCSSKPGSSSCCTNSVRAFVVL
jgi:hypothetical protein